MRELFDEAIEFSPHTRLIETGWIQTRQSAQFDFGGLRDAELFAPDKTNVAQPQDETLHRRKFGGLAGCVFQESAPRSPVSSESFDRVASREMLHQNADAEA